MKADLKEKLMNLLYPPGLSCALCAQEAFLDDTGLCTPCMASITRCNAFPALEYTDGFTAGLMYDEDTAEAIHGFKYNDKRYLASFFAQFIILPNNWEIDCIVPVPLHKKRLARRGYNQSALIAQELAKKKRHRCGRNAA